MPERLGLEQSELRIGAGGLGRVPDESFTSMISFRETVRQMQIDDAAMVRHIDALLRDFVAENRTLFDFWGDLPTESALSEAGWQFFREGDLRLRGDESLPRLELVGDVDSRKIARRQNLKWWHAFEALQITGAVDPFFSMAD